MNRWFDLLTVDKPFIVPARGIADHVKDNLLLVIICTVAGLLHIYPLFQPILIIGDETQHLQAGLWMYQHIDDSWHILFQIVFWLLLVAGLIFLKVKKTDDGLLSRFDGLWGGKAGSKSKSVYIVSFILFLVIYFLLLRNITYGPQFIRYPHLIKLLYQFAYYAFGITHVGPRVLQLVFYLLAAVYIYRTISLYSSRETAIIGASISLFLPVVFVYAKFAEVGCGTVFFIVLISFHFLRFIKEGDARDLLLTSFLIGTGFMYKRSVFVMFFICAFYLVVRSILNRDVNYKNNLKVMLISLVPIIPWMIIGKFYSWRNYKIIWSNFIPFEGKVYSFFMNMPLDISWLFFVLFLISLVYFLCVKRNELSLFFALLFVTYYFFLALDVANYSPRLAMTYYPAIVVYLALLLHDVIDNIRWKHSFKVIYIALSIYLVSICTVPSLNAQYLSSVEFLKLKYFPSDVAMKWVKDHVNKGEKVLTIRIMSSDFYRVKYGIDMNRIVGMWYMIDEVSTPEKLRAFSREHNLSYIMFPYNPDYIKSSSKLNILEFLKNNPYSEFEEIERFNIENNYIYIYKL